MGALCLVCWAGGAIASSGDLSGDLLALIAWSASCSGGLVRIAWSTSCSGGEGNDSGFLVGLPEGADLAAAPAPGRWLVLITWSTSLSGGEDGNSRVLVGLPGGADPTSAPAPGRVGSVIIWGTEPGAPDNRQAWPDWPSAPLIRPFRFCDSKLARRSFHKVRRSISIPTLMKSVGLRASCALREAISTFLYEV